MKFSSQYKLFTSLVVFFPILFIALGAYCYFDANRQLYQEMSGQVKIQAEEIALMPNLRQRVSQHDLQAIRMFMQQIAAHGDASFIVIDNRQGVHLSHSVHPEQVGTRLVGGDNQAVLKGHTITTIRKGGLGVSLRSKASTVDDKGQMVGIVSVGYLTSYLDSITPTKVINIFIAAILLLIALFIFSWYFARNIKKQIFSLEPQEIDLPVRQQKAMMESIFKGVIVIGHQRRIEVINHAARSLLGLSRPVRQLCGQSINSVISPQPFFASGDMLERDTRNELCRLNQLTMLANQVRIMLENTLQGWVITFRDHSEINTLTAQLNQAKRCVDNLRIICHEQLNRMTTLSGLLHTGHHDEAIHCIQAQSEHARKLLDFISSHFHSPTLCGLLLGKATRARGKDMVLSFDPACRIDRPLPSLEESKLISVVDNLLNNAIGATQRAKLPHEPMEVLIQLNARELVIEVADRGVSIHPDIRGRIFERSVTTKARGNHGIGLYFIRHYVTQAGGTVGVADNTPQGTIFTLFIPADASTCPQAEARNTP